MNDRERFRACMTFQAVDRMPRWEWGFRSDTTSRWYGEGLPASVPDTVGWAQYFGLDRGCGYANGAMAERLNVNVELLPGFENAVIEEDDRTVLSRNRWGALTRSSKVGQSIPQYLSFGVRTRDDLRKYRSAWDAAAPQRYPADWDDRKRRWRGRDFPVAGWTYGWYGLLRELMGVEELSVAFHEDEALIDEVCEFWGDFIIQAFHRALVEATPDYVLFWEDLAFKTGPPLSPRHFRRFFLPHYKRVIEDFRRHGVTLFMVDSDGNINDIIPLWIEAGVNILAPFEVAAGMDVVQVGRQYGRDLAMIGGVDKMEVAKGRLAMEAEVWRHVVPLLDRGGYIPTLDHAVLPETSLGDYRNYLSHLRSTCESGKGQP